MIDKGESRLRELKDNLYLFSLSTDNYGSVIAQRTRESSCAYGKSIFEYLGICESEMRFLNGSEFSEVHVPVIVVGNRGGNDNLVLIHIPSPPEIAIGIALEITAPNYAIGDVYRDNAEAMSPLAKRLIESYREESRDPNIEITVSRTLSLLLSLSSKATDRGSDGVSQISCLLYTAAELVCVPIECSVRSEDVGGSDSALLHTSACLFITLAMAMASRRHARDRGLRALISARDDFISLSLAYECGDDEWSGSNILRHLIGECQMTCELCAKDGRMICSMVPSYVDEALLGVKDRIGDMELLEFWK